MIIHKWVISIISHSSLFKKTPKDILLEHHKTHLESFNDRAPALDVVSVHLRWPAPQRRNSRDLLVVISY